ncbi:hypothetical protein [Rhodococcus sp. UNC363MFTsu5.1]|uniref:hypothetical protein n=1 Tax=Rhodococcus sp. UNC363MFTsu5.1 TaxID=1449069 RepID=UPI0004861C8F|nr:hypothetical protein [Rhodococcus sp. UNC363MFTsu5.1]
MRTVSIHMHRDPEEGVTQRGGEFGGGNLLLGLSSTEGAPADFNDPDQWITTGDLFELMAETEVDTARTAAFYRGWYPAVIGINGIATVLMPVDRIEVAA